jgi:hypothetical protein
MAFGHLPLDCSHTYEMLAMSKIENKWVLTTTQVASSARFLLQRYWVRYWVRIQIGTPEGWSLCPEQ